MDRAQRDLFSPQWNAEPAPEEMTGSPGDLPRVLGVAELAALIDDLLLDERLIECFVRGEVTNYHRHASGHRYFSLSEERDGERALVPCVVWRRDGERLEHELEDGQSVIAFGSIGHYAAGGRYQFYVREAEPVGIGDAYLQVERWRCELEAEGCFVESRKRALPRYPVRVGVVTSPTGAVLHDIVNVLRRRYPVEVVLSPTDVQGDGAEEEIASAIRRVDGQVDVIVIARGGGAFEDLAVFNHPVVVRAVAGSGTPVVSAVGHEVDVTLCDIAADLRAPTPSAAAELVVPDRGALLEELRHARRHLVDLLHRRWEEADDEIGGLRDRLRPARLAFRIDSRREELAELESRLARGRTRALDRRRAEVSGLASLVAVCSPFAPLARGYALIARDGRPVREARGLVPGTVLTARFGRGRARLRVEEVCDDEDV